ncbi:glyoxylase-like metal-dependent hydrolase (beta-lactamase superfamily II) [Stackebrandtia endophytica]|uniref:Glyoxylase-like metal-dependent hydrolase (Beta-lactamase superfamily II) n=1 Tax=Stackebrandtia endophytica TaxID=1496996 RepID=A0A543ASS4_9ACTN|nr:MBL fold metallo-hydrolase [Stackebrandtia endophytica]TQL75642.1 glyoxylase-like metal-dependent hydrolase (beta-lactamase superfamily II) [Stackebrandtia endophytica]
MTSFRAVTDDVYVLRYPVLDVNCTLIVGERRALLVDTLSGPSQAGLLARRVREVTDLPVIGVNTHVHFDHVFGNATVATQLGITDFWAHATVIDELSRRPCEARADAYQVCARLAPDIADEVRGVEILVPNQTVDTEVELDLGDRVVRLWHPGRAHSDGDLVIITDDVLLAGDLVEEGAPPNTNGSDLAGWTRALDMMLPKVTGPVIPGHGAVVDAAFVRRQRDEIAAMS